MVLISVWSTVALAAAAGIAVGLELQPAPPQYLRGYSQLQDGLALQNKTAFNNNNQLVQEVAPYAVQQPDAQFTYQPQLQSGSAIDRLCDSTKSNKKLSKRQRLKRKKREKKKRLQKKKYKKKLRRFLKQHTAMAVPYETIHSNPYISLRDLYYGLRYLYKHKIQHGQHGLTTDNQSAPSSPAFQYNSPAFQYNSPAFQYNSPGVQLNDITMRQPDNPANADYQEANKGFADPVILQ